jgi:hypothetical protein
LGVQVLPGAAVVPGGQAVPVKKKQALRSQQARTDGHRLGEQVFPGAGFEPVGHGPALVKHVPSTRQHAVMHKVGVHTLPGPNHVPGRPVGSMQPACVLVKHCPFTQQAPTHVFEVQVVPRPMKILGETHWLGGRMAQLPSLRQHAPRQGFGVHGTPVPRNWPPAARQLVWLVITQKITPGSSGIQHAPIGGGGQGLVPAVHVEPMPRSRLPKGHACVELTVMQVPSDRQHA